jgi:protein TonB
MSSPQTRPPTRRLALGACAALLAVPLMLLSGCDQRPAAPRKMQMVKLLPDTPPPPPPPPKPEDKKPEPKEDRPQPQLPQAKPVEAPQQQALRSDEAAGDGPGGGLVAGPVSKEYSGERIGGGTIGGTGADEGGARLAAASFANAATRALNEFLARDRELRRADYRVRVNLWLDASGALQRIELVEGTGDAGTDQILRTALSRFPGPGATPPERMPQPLRVLVTNRMIG